MVLVVIYLAVMAWLVFGPAPGSEANELGDHVRQAGAVLARRVDTGMTNEEISNVLLFVPFPALVAVWSPRRWWVALPAGIAVSIAIELVQLVVLDHRSPTWNDVRWNSAGVLIGTALIAGVVAVRRIMRSRLSSVA